MQESLAFWIIQKRKLEIRNRKLESQLIIKMCFIKWLEMIIGTKLRVWAIKILSSFLLYRLVKTTARVGTRTHDRWNKNSKLYRLSYSSWMIIENRTANKIRVLLKFHLFLTKQVSLEYFISYFDDMSVCSPMTYNGRWMRPFDNPSVFLKQSPYEKVKNI